jgi:hypothetical protein
MANLINAIAKKLGLSKDLTPEEKRSAIIEKVRSESRRPREFNLGGGIVPGGTIISLAGEPTQEYTQEYTYDVVQGISPVLANGADDLITSSDQAIRDVTVSVDTVFQRRIRQVEIEKYSGVVDVRIPAEVIHRGSLSVRRFIKNRLDEMRNSLNLAVDHLEPEPPILFFERIEYPSYGDINRQSSTGE